ncbi:MAG: hypothetical protein HY678_01715 [Chloroflexi bacterium]|nr:hypothetical protein [Chloroflexota bacterium]
MDTFLASFFPTGTDVITSIQPNAARNAYHTLLQLPHAMLTASAVRTPRDVVRRAAFRNQYAQLQSRFVIDEITNDLHLEDDVDPLQAVVYAMVIHGPASWKARYANGFVHIVFLDNEGKYLDGRIRLEQEFPDVLAELAGIEQISDTAQVQPLVEPLKESVEDDTEQR